MKILAPFSLFGKIILPGLASVAVIITQGFLPHAAQGGIVSTSRVPSIEASHPSDSGEPVNASFTNYQDLSASQISAYSFGNPAGCSASTPAELSADQMLANIQLQLGDSLILAPARQYYIWNGPLNTMMDVTEDKFVFEFSVDDFQPPFTYRADPIATIFLNNGFVVWFRSYGGHFRLTAVPVMDGVYESVWGDYVSSYWQNGGIPDDDNIQPVTKKLPCHWIIDQGWVTDEQLRRTFNFDWSMPDYLIAGRKYLASNCKDANRISQEEIGYWDASSMCGPLTWQIVKDANSFPYRIGNWYSSARLFTQANPRWNWRPWLGFDPETYDLISTEMPMMGYDFATNGNLYAGDIIYSYATLYVSDDGRFDHIFMVAGVDANGGRLSISNMVQNAPYADCFIREVTLYTPGDLETGVINHEWNDHGFGRTGTTGFDVLRWKWITYHAEGKPIQYTVRWGDTLETIAFDWKISPQSVLDANQFVGDIQLTPGQIITLPAPPAL